MRCSYFCAKNGFSRIEWLIFLGLLLILGAVCSVPASAYLEQSRINRAVESARTINTLLSQYATDNNGVYPVGEGTSAAGKSEGIARSLLQNNYAPDAMVFAVASTPRYTGTASDFSDLSAANLSWDFTAGATLTTGITNRAPDQLPTVYGTGEVITYPTVPGSGFDLALSGKGPFGDRGIVVAYKGNNAVFIKGVLSGGTVICPEFIPKTFKDTAAYTQIKP
jgi:type II secretory pathway pseudopilin PulG